MSLNFGLFGVDIFGEDSVLIISLGPKTMDLVGRSHGGRGRNQVNNRIIGLFGPGQLYIPWHYVPGPAFWNISASVRTEVKIAQSSFSKVSCHIDAAITNIIALSHIFSS